MKKENKILLGILIIVVIFLMYNSGKKESVLLGEQVLYYNEPILVKFTTSLVDGNVQAYFNNQEYNATISKIENTYSVSFDNLKQAGLAKVVVTKGSESEVMVIEVKKPFVKCVMDFPISISKGVSEKLTIKTYTPQGTELDAETIDVVLYDPNNDQTTVTFDKSGNTFSKDYKFEKAGAFIFKIYGKQPGFDTEEYTAIVDVTQPEGVPLIIYIWMAMIGSLILLFIIARIRGKKIGKK